MLLTLETTHRPATDLGYLLHKNPANVHGTSHPFGRSTLVFPEASEERCRAALILEVDPVALVRGRGQGSGAFDQYVNDRPYVGSSLMSVAMNKVFSSAMKGRSRERAELATVPIPLRAELPAVSLRGGAELARRVFEPVGYRVEAEALPLDPRFPAWGEARVHRLALEGEVLLADLLNHLYVLLPVLDDTKHYYVGADEVEKLVERAGGWLASHPERDLIVKRALRRDRGLFRAALERLVPAGDEDPDEAQADRDAAEERIERPLSLAEQRREAVLDALREVGARTVLDLGCGEGTYLRALLKERGVKRAVGVDVSVRSLERAAQRLRLERMGDRQRERVELLHGSLTYRDQRFEGFDAALLVEVIEHLEPERLAACERTVFEFARPETVVVTTPNVEYNVRWESLPAGSKRHGDHRFEWTRDEFRGWSEGVSARFGYAVEWRPVGPFDEEVGPPTQMAVFHRAEGVQP